MAGARRAFPLGLTLARAFVAPSLALAGDAAHGIHPISGQGLNLGFKDVAALAETIVEADRLGLDIGALNVLERSQTWRLFDTFRLGDTPDARATESCVGKDTVNQGQSRGSPYPYKKT